MQQANGRLVLNKVGSDVPVMGITPAEALLLHILHQGNNGGRTFGEDMGKIEITGDAMEQGTKTVIDKPAVPEQVIPATATTPAKTVPAIPAVTHEEPAMVKRTDTQELRRLTKKYGHCVNKKGDKIIKLIWPGLNPTLPQNFSDLKWAEIQYDGVDVAALDYVTGKPVDK